jgi:hypothetical protein
MQRLTLDTNLLQEYWREQQRRDVVERLLQLADAGKVELVVTNRINDDIPSAPLADRLRELPEMGVSEIGSVFRLNHPPLGGVDTLGSDIFLTLQKQADAELRRRGRATVPDWRDWDHLHGHFLKHRDVFLTWDKRLLEAAGIVAEQLPVTAVTPDAYLAARSIAKDVLARLESEGGSPPP